MKPLQIYIDSSVIGGYFDDEFQEPTRELWAQMKQGHFQFVASYLLDQEIQRSPVRVRELMDGTFPDKSKFLKLTDEAVELAEAYLRQNVVPPAYADDARHVAIATVSGVTLIASWNFRHLVNLRREAGFNNVNALQNYPSIRIVSPLQLIHGHEKEI